MARPRSEAKQKAILKAALLEFAENGLAAPTAAIAKRAEVATGTLFTYFSTKEDLQNALYLQLKAEVYGRMNDGFPLRGSLEARLRHLWQASITWAMELPAKRRVSIQLNLSDVLTPATRAASAAMSVPTQQALNELEARGQSRGLPRGLSTACMSHLQDAALELMPSTPKRQRETLLQQTFAAFWRILS